LTYVEGLLRTLFFPPKKSAKPATSRGKNRFLSVRFRAVGPSAPYRAAAARQANRAAKGCVIIDTHPKTPRSPEA